MVRTLIFSNPEWKKGRVVLHPAVYDEEAGEWRPSCKAHAKSNINFPQTIELRCDETGKPILPYPEIMPRLCRSEWPDE